jgi:NAD(P)-dependent dehydrogenase (short-subunit alcohol dehydrogenase family)
MPKHIIVTGANGNLGSAVVKRFLASDYHVVAIARSGSGLGFAEGLSNFELHAVDLADESRSKDFFTELISLKGNIDAALLLAGGFASGNIETTDLASINRMMALNFETVYNAARPIFLHMLQNGSGRLVFVGAKSALDATTAKEMIGYALSKTMLFKLADLLNAEAAGTNVLVSVIAPGTMDTATNRDAMPGADTSLWTKPEEVAGILHDICSGSNKVLVL